MYALLSMAKVSHMMICHHLGYIMEKTLKDWEDQAKGLLKAELDA